MILQSAEENSSRWPDGQDPTLSTTLSSSLSHVDGLVPFLPLIPLSNGPIRFIAPRVVDDIHARSLEWRNLSQWVDGLLQDNLDHAFGERPQVEWVVGRARALRRLGERDIRSWTLSGHVPVPS